jgi:hypothetical protein
MFGLIKSLQLCESNNQTRDCEDESDAPDEAYSATIRWIAHPSRASRQALRPVRPHDRHNANKREEYAARKEVGRSSTTSAGCRQMVDDQRSWSGD